MTDEAQLKTKLQKLINDSRTLKSLPTSDRQAREAVMLASDSATMQKFIEVLENEAAQMQQLDKDYDQNVTELNSLVAEAKQLEAEANTVIRKEAEAEEKAGDEQKAKSILEELDKISE